MNSSELSNLEIIEDICILTINNPPQNYLNNPEFINFNYLKEYTKKAKGLIIKGAGRHFSAGADLNSLSKTANNPDLLRQSIKKGTEVLFFIENLNIPVIACIEGACFGGGFEIALACHIKIASEKALFSFPETDLGLIPGLNGSIRLPKLINKAKSLEILLSNDIFNADTAYKLRIIDYIVQNKKTFEFSMNLMNKMVKNRELDIINSIVQSINNSTKMSFEQAMEEELNLFCKLAIKKQKNETENKTT